MRITGFLFRVEVEEKKSGHWRYVREVNLNYGGVECIHVFAYLSWPI